MMARANTYVTDLRHYLDEETGELAANMPAPALRLAMFFASIVAWATSQSGDDGERTNVWCWRRPDRTRCRGEIIACLPSGAAEIVWQCPFCGLNGVIRGWEASLWDQRRPSA
jgi:hypothetical protein